MTDSSISSGSASTFIGRPDSRAMNTLSQMTYPSSVRLSFGRAATAGGLSHPDRTSVFSDSVTKATEDREP